MLVTLSAGHYAIGHIAQHEAPIRPGHWERRGPTAPGEPVARLRIPGIGLDAVVLEGTSSAVLRRGPGHLAGTEMPGRALGYNNCVIAGHRDSFFRHLGAVRDGDRLFLGVGREECEYRVVRHRIVLPSDIAVAAATRRPRLTLITCYPFHWIGHAPYRFVLEAEPLSESRRFSGLPNSTSVAPTSASPHPIASR